MALIDEDVWLVREMSEELQKLGYRVLGWTSPTFAAELLAKQPCDVIVTEGAMSSLSGGELCAQAIETYGEARPGFVLHTAAPKKAPRKARALFDATVTKPSTVQDLVAAIEAARAARPAAALVPPVPPQVPQPRVPSVPAPAASADAASFDEHAGAEEDADEDVAVEVAAPRDVPAREETGPKPAPRPHAAAR